MAIIYVRSTDGLNTDSGATWALAKLNLSGAAAIDAAGDTVYVSQVHSQTDSTSIFHTWQGNSASAVSVICANDAAEPPTVVATTANVVVTSSSAQMQIAGAHFCYGINYINNGTATNCHIWLHNGADQAQLWEECTFELNSAGASSLQINAVGTSTGNVRFRNVDVKLVAAGSSITPQADNFKWEGGSTLAGTSATGLITLSTGRTTNVQISNVDFTNMPQAFYFIGTGGGGNVIIRNCKLPTGWTGGLFNGTMDWACRAEMYNCDAGSTNYNTLIQDHTGIISDETVIKRANGASDGFTSYSFKIVTTANCNARYGQLFSPEIAIWNDVVASPVTLTLDICHDSLTALTNAEAWLEVEYPSSATSPIYALGTDGIATPLTTATDQTASTNTWTTTGLVNPNKQALSVTVTPQARGYLYARVVVAKPSYTLYMDTKLQVS